MKVSSDDFPVLYSNICRIQVADKTGHHNHLFRHFTHSHVEYITSHIHIFFWPTAKKVSKFPVPCFKAALQYKTLGIIPVDLVFLKTRLGASVL